MKLVKIGATWCGQCKVLDTQLRKFKEQMEVISLDVEKDFNEVEKLPRVKNLPTLFIMNGDEVVETLVGSIRASDITEALNKH